MALEAFRLAAALNPRAPETHHNMGVVYEKLGRSETALTCYGKACALNPALVAPHKARGALFQALGRYDDALASYAAALAADPLDPASHADLALCHLRLGNFKDGWREYEWRWQVDALKPLPAPLWLGAEPLAGKTILLHSEQGLGDTLQFCRYIPMVAGLGARVVLGAPQALTEVLAPFEGVDKVSPLMDELTPFDLQCPLMSLAVAFDTTTETIPWSGAYIAADDVRTAQWASELGPRSRPRFGIAWSGNPLHKNDANRSIALETFVEGLPPGPQYHVLLHRISALDREFLASRSDIICHEDRINSLSDTAALCAHLDGVISVDTSLAHLAGAMDKPVWILLPQPADWRWMVNRQDSPWYPSASLIRQPTRGDWPGALADLKDQLTRFIAGSAMASRL